MIPLSLSSWAYYFLQSVSHFTGLTYQSVSVLLCLVVVPSLCAVSALVACVSLCVNGARKHSSRNPWPICVAFTLYALGLACLCVALFRHYHLWADSASCDAIFDQCVADIEALAQSYSISYNSANLILFVILPLLVFIFNCAVAWRNRRRV